MLCLSLYEWRCVYPGEQTNLAPFLEKRSLDRALGRMADFLFAPRHAEADVLLTTVVGPLHTTMMEKKCLNAAERARWDPRPRQIGRRGKGGFGVVRFARHATSWSAPRVGGADIATLCRAHDRWKHEIPLYGRCTIDEKNSAQHSTLWCAHRWSTTNIGGTILWWSHSHHATIPAEITILWFWCAPLGLL